LAGGILQNRLLGLTPYLDAPWRDWLAWIKRSASTVALLTA
jgi:hypothetical protein